MTSLIHTAEGEGLQLRKLASAWMRAAARRYDNGKRDDRWHRMRLRARLCQLKAKGDVWYEGTK